jgi:4'-phosphopantetheinyl transferase
MKYYHLKDAKMSLASHLLKHLIITKYCDVPWSDSTISRDVNGKPCFIPDVNNPNQAGIDFNVSHQAGIVSLVAAVGFKVHVDVGTDVVCANERLKQDYAHIDKDGFFDWIDIHGDVFAESEVSYMKLGPLEMKLEIPGAQIQGYGNDALSRCERRGGKLDIKVVGEDQKGTTVQVERNQVIDAKLRRFYAMWCLREAYVKMTGEALLAPWLRDLEISDVQAPVPKDGIQDSQSLEEGEVLKDFKIYFKEKAVTDVSMELSALGTGFMVAGSVRRPIGESASAVAMDKWQQLDLETDILAVAEAAS